MRGDFSYQLREHGQLYYLPVKLGKKVCPVMSDAMNDDNVNDIGKILGLVRIGVRGRLAARAMVPEP
eukprot:1549839-Heterocapsa_arctica.AAC.1